MKPIRLLLLFVLAFPSFAAGVHGNSSDPSPFTRLGNMLYFATDEGPVWQTNGRQQATTYFDTHAAAGPLTLPVGFRDELYFFSAGTDLWASTGVRARFLARLYFRPAEALATETHIVFSDPTTIGSSDGTPAGTHVLVDFGGQVAVDLLGAAGRFAYFTVYDRDVRELALWRTDGTREGTYAIAHDIDDVYDAAAFGDLFVYMTGDGVWRTDGTSEGTLRLRDRAMYIGVAGGALWLGGNTGLWRSDGTPAGTQRVSESLTYARITANANGRVFVLQSAGPDVRISTWQHTAFSEPVIVPGFNVTGKFAPLGDTVVFTMEDEAHGLEVWRTDGTAAGTHLLRDIARGPEHSSPYALTAVAGRVVFAANDREHGYEPWTTDGTREGTKMLANAGPEAVLRGRVTDAATGAPVAQARIAFYEAQGDFLGATETADDGTYAFEFLDPDEYDLEATSTTHVAEKREHVPLVAYRTNVADFALHAGGTISGRITDPRGAPVANSRVVAATTYGAQPIATARTSADGTYVLGGLPAERSWLVYTIGENGWSGVIYPNVSCAPGCNAASSGTRIQLAARERRDDVHFTIARWGRIRGRVVDAATGLPTGRPMQITAHPQGKPMETWLPSFTVYLSDRESEFELTLPDGTYHVLASWNTYGGTMPGPYDPTWYPSTPCEPCTTLAGAPVWPVAGQTIDLDFRLPSRLGHVAGRVLTPDGKPAADVVLAPGFASTNADGTYAIMNVPPGPFRVHGVATKTWAGTIEGDAEVHVHVHANAVVQAPDLVVHRWGTLRGIVVDAATKFPLPADVFVDARGSSGSGYVSARVNGAFFAGELRRGPFEVRTSIPGYAGTIRFGVNANASPWPRVATIGLPGKIVTITQAGRR